MAFGEHLWRLEFLRGDARVGNYGSGVGSGVEGKDGV